MNERNTFEMRLENMFVGYADRAPVEVDASTLATHIAAARPRRVYDRMTARNRWLVPLLIGLLLIATLAATVYVAAQLLTPRVIGYDEHFAIGADISDPRPNPIAVALADGRVVISTGWDGDGGADQVQAQIYDPGTGESEALGGAKPYGGDGAGIRLADGRVLLLMFSMNTTSSRAYLVDPATSSVRELDQPGDSNAPPFGVLPSTALLKDGRVLIAGGQSDVFSLDMLATAVLFDPVSESFVPTGSMSEPRTDHSLITLRDGRVLAVGGDLAMDHGSIGDSTESAHLISSAEVYDPNTGEFTSTGGLTTFEGRTLGVLLTDGRVAVMPQYIADPMGGS